MTADGSERILLVLFSPSRPPYSVSQSVGLLGSSLLLSLLDHRIIRRNQNLDTTVLCPSLFGRVVGNRIIVGQSPGCQTRRINLLSDQIVRHSLSPFFGELLIDFPTTRVIRMTVYSYIRLGRLSQRLCKFFQRSTRCTA